MTDKPHYHGHRQRLRERLGRDPRSLADYEVLELLLAQVIKRQDTKPMAKELLTRFQTLRGVFQARDEELREVKGFGPALETFWKLWRETWARLHEQPVRERQVLDSPWVVVELARARIGHEASEEFWVAFTDKGNRLLAFERVSRGTVDQTSVYPREVIAMALEKKAASMILVHNHPGGSLQPSEGDKQITLRLLRSASDLGLKILDHIIVTDKGHYSFQEHDMLPGAF
jgi:DNA repair protein RadC